jgi:2'-5' RNA ligase
MKRLFIAIKLNFPYVIINQFNEIKSLFIKEKIKWVNFNQLHLTLKFLGDTDTELIPEITKIIEKVSQNSSKFNLNFKGTGIFKDFKNLRVIWIGIDKNPHLFNLHKAIDNELSKIGIKPENRRFNPHLTLGRIKYINNKKKLIDFILKNTNRNFIEIQVNEFYLIESILKKDGPTYIDVERFTLNQ